MSAENKKKSNVGRKPSNDPKIAVQFYIETSKVNAVGGVEKARTICAAMLPLGADLLNEFIKMHYDPTYGDLVWRLAIKEKAEAILDKINKQ